MLKYLVILLDDASTSYCHYDNSEVTHKLISLSDLKDGILFAMKENLMVQFVYSAYDLPREYDDLIETIDHSKITPVAYDKEADVVVADCWEDLETCCVNRHTPYVLRLKKTDFFGHYEKIGALLPNIARLNVILTDIDSFTESDLKIYKSILAAFVPLLSESYKNGATPQFNLLTDRMMLDSMNNCNAGWESMTLAPDGRFYICPAFYLSADGYSVGDLHTGLDIKNPQLYRLDHAPLCRNCDAYQCKRCIWLNRKTTFEVNTPSHEQCTTAHLERNASRDLLQEIRKSGDSFPSKEIREIDYLDPFDIRKRF